MIYLSKIDFKITFHNYKRTITVNTECQLSVLMSGLRGSFLQGDLKIISSVLASFRENLLLLSLA